jgi:hypothetical protein
MNLTGADPSLRNLWLASLVLIFPHVAISPNWEIISADAFELPITI